MFAFLGFEIRMAKSRRTGNHYPHVQPSKKSLKAIKDRITGLTARTRAIMPLDLLVNRDRETGYVRFTNRDLYEKYGLYKVPTTAGWTKAHALQ
uniref:Uncharacterized protein n=1 Tax=uncultured Desulfobacterium sp. TaxID=201089 RepID=E1YIY8_9BACT|nr:hypothetical protein N47_K27720 [uncultured Desulfobacterium sp.]